MTYLRKKKRHDKDQIILRFKKQLRQNYRAKPGILPYVLILDNLKASFNIGKIFRSADAFGAREIHLIGTTYFDPGPAKGSLKWIPSFFHEDFASCHQMLSEQGYTFFTLEPESEQCLHGSRLPAQSAFILGHEEFGISFARSAYPDIQALKIEQYGKVQSLNVSIAATIVMYEYSRQHQPLLSAAAAGGQPK